MPASVNLKNISIILNRPRYPENIGAAARAMRNMGFERLIVVDPQNYDMPRVLKMATHAAVEVVERIQVYEDLQNALEHLSYIVGTTARLGGQRQLVGSAARLAEKLAPISVENQVGLLFGPEDRGLTNDDIRLRRYNQPGGKTFVPRLANRHELDGMYAQLKDILVRISYIQPDNPDYFMNNLRHFGTRLKLRAKEVSIIRGICRQIDWYGKKCYRDGQQDRRD